MSPLLALRAGVRRYSTTKPSTVSDQTVLEQLVGNREKIIRLLSTDTGLSIQQSETVLRCLDDSISASMSGLRGCMIPNEAADQTIRAYKLDFAHLKSEIHLLEKNDFAILKQDNDRIASEVDNVKVRLREDLQKLQSGVQLEMNLERSRVRDEQNALRNKVTDVDNRLESEIQRLKLNIDNVRWDTVKTIAATVASFGLGVLGFVSLWRG